MTKKGIVLALVDAFQLSHQQGRGVVQMLFDLIIDALVTEGRIELRNFGVFEVKRRAARRAHNPKTGDHVHIPERLVVTFKPGKAMQQRVEDATTTTAFKG